MQEALSLFSLLTLRLRRGFIKILLAQSSAQKIRNGGEFQQRGQKNSANSLQMCLRAVRGNTVLPSLERKKDSAWTKFNELRGENNSEPGTAGSDSLSGFPGKRKEATQEHKRIVFTLWRSCWYAETQECMLVILKAETETHIGNEKCIHSCFTLEILLS